MSTKFRNLKNDLKDLEDDTVSQLNQGRLDKNSNSGKLSNYILLFAFIATLVFYVGSRIDYSGINDIPDRIEQAISEPSEDLLLGMGAWMTEMGYGELSREELINLRREGVTATETQQLHDIGYTDITLDQLVELQNAGVSSDYARMMKELGYSLTIEELAETRRAGVTANFTSRMMDLGYTKEELTKENLMRMRGVNVTDGIAARLMEQRGERLTVDELVRYRISNQ
ncbi:MAG: hypothetical protein CL662_06025 [Bacteroidetes bacterium]|jgi:hypothetical protein|nr:hypothetical protein [Bacteroidota bacterium]MAC06731.1 hypothetical protein [Balneola sp.]MAO76927.1 hypothetical protein [Balneola sp.]MBF64494.1 hypothetical protein [Balneola sp.]MBF65746.1 hypothetical protein [Balneola sp.]|tara:strand:- start:3115 stop:3798 length:684 start_codon:yes stop_codon:yes gene_type:complete